MSHSQNDNGHPRVISVGVADAARITGLSKSSIYNYARRGELPLKKLGSKTLILVDDLQRLVSGANV